MILVVALFGHEVFRIELASPAPTEDDGATAELTSVHRHSGEFGFGASPARPYWSHDPEESPPVVRGRGAGG